MSNAVWIYPWDLIDEGIETVLSRLQEYNINGVNVAVNYHTGRFFLPHNPKRKLYYPEPGALYFNPDPVWYEKAKIKPPVSKFASKDFLKKLREQTAKRNMKLTAWSLGLHNSYVGFNYPEMAVENVFGDLDKTSLCPANEDVRKLFIDMYTDLAQNYDFDNILIESLEFMPFRHGYHHEVFGIPISATEAFFMSLSFSPELCNKANDVNIDISSVKSYLKKWLEEGFSNPFDVKQELSWDEIHGLVGGQMKAYLKFREELVSSLLKEVSEAIKSNGSAKLSVLDFGPLYPLEPCDLTWQSGANLRNISDCASEIHPTFYFSDPEVFRQKVDKYVDILNKLPKKIDMVPALRAILPQVGTLEDLSFQVNYLKPYSKGLTFYNYGFMAYETLEWIADTID